MADYDETLPPPHLRPNPIPASDEEDGAIKTNLEDDLDDEGYTLPAVDRGGEVEEFETGTSLRGVEGRMRWLVGVCMGKDEKVSKGVPGKLVRVHPSTFAEQNARSRSDHFLQLQHDIATYFGYNTFLVGKLMKLFPADEVCLRGAASIDALDRH